MQGLCFTCKFTFGCFNVYNSHGNEWKALPMP